MFTRNSRLRLRPDAEDLPVAPIRIALRTGLLNLIVTTGVAVPLALGAIYVVLKAASLVP